MSLQVRCAEKTQGLFEIAVSGRLDTTTYAQLEAQIGLIMPRASGIILEMSQMDYISSMGLRVIFKAMKDLKARNGHLMVSGMQPPVKKVFEIANAIDESMVFINVEEADRYYAGIQKQVREQNS